MKSVPLNMNSGRFGRNPGVFSLTAVSAILLAEAAAIILVLQLDSPSALAVGLLGIANIVLLGGASIREFIGNRTMPTPMAAYLLSAAFRAGLGSCHVAACIAFGFHSELRHGPTFVSEFIMPAFALYLFGDAMMLAGFSLVFRRSSRERTARVFGASHVARLRTTALLMLGFGWLLQLLVLSGNSLGRATSLIPIFGYALPAAATLMIFTLDKVSHRASHGVRLAWLLTGINVAISVFSEAKSTTLIALLPAAIHVIGTLRETGNKSIRPRLSTIMTGAGIAVFVLMFLFPLVQRLRTARERNGGELTSQTKYHVASEVGMAMLPGTDAFASVHKFPVNGLWSFPYRQRTILAVAFSCQHVSHHGTLEGKILHQSLASVVPRFIWPDKPEYRIGTIIARLAGYSRSNQTKIDAGDMAGGLYLDLGLPAVAVGMFLTGAMMGFWTNVFRRQALTNPAAGCAMMLMYVWCFQHFESGVTWNLTGWITTALLFGLMRVWDMSNHTERSSPSHRQSTPRLRNAA